MLGDDIIFDVGKRDVSAAVALPMTLVLLQAVRNSWEHPALGPTSTKHLDHMYRIQEATARFLYTHLKPKLLVVSSSMKVHRHQSYPPDKDGKRMDIFGRHIYSTNALAINSCNYLACMACNTYSLMEDLSFAIPLLPEEHRACLLHIQGDGIAVAKQQNSTSKHILEASS